MSASIGLRVSAVAAGCVVLAACSGAPIRTSEANLNIDPGHVDRSHARSISASASGFQLFAIIPVMINSRQQRAYDAMLSQARGDYVTDISVDEKWTYAFIATVHTTTVAATAYPVTATGAAYPASNRGQIIQQPKTVSEANSVPKAATVGGASSLPRDTQSDWLGKNDFTVRKVARENGCASPRLLNATQTTEIFQVTCSDGQEKLIQCEFTNCALVK